MTEHGLTIDQYRTKYSLPGTYPMVAPDYAKTRSSLAKEMGLGKSRSAAPKKPDAENNIHVLTASLGRVRSTAVSASFEFVGLAFLFECQRGFMEIFVKYNRMGACWNAAREPPGRGASALSARWLSRSGRLDATSSARAWAASRYVPVGATRLIRFPASASSALK